MGEWEVVKPPGWDDRPTLPLRGPTHPKWDHMTRRDRAVVLNWWFDGPPVFHAIRFWRDGEWVEDDITRCGRMIHPSERREIPLWALRGRARPCKQCFDLDSDLGEAS